MQKPISIQIINNMRKEVARRLPFDGFTPIKKVKTWLLGPQLDALEANSAIQEKFNDAVKTFTTMFNIPTVLDSELLYCMKTVHDVPKQTFEIAATMIRSYGFRLDVRPIELTKGTFKVMMVPDYTIANYNFVRLVNPSTADHSSMLGYLRNARLTAVNQ